MPPRSLHLPETLIYGLITRPYREMQVLFPLIMYIPAFRASMDFDLYMSCCPDNE